MSTINAVLADGYAVDLSPSTGHRWQADEPVGVGGTDTSERERLAEVAASCPVHKTLEKGVHLIDEVSFA